MAAQRSHEVMLSADVARIADHRNVRIAPGEFKRKAPHRLVAVDVFAVAAESPVDYAYPPYAGIVDPLHRSDPKVKVGIHRILDQYRDVTPNLLKRIGYFLHREWICRSSGSDPYDVHSGSQCADDVAFRGHFRAHFHSGHLLHLHQPGQPRESDSFEASGHGARFPDSGAEYLHSPLCQFLSYVCHLLLAFRRAGAADDDRLLHYMFLVE